MAKSIFIPGTIAKRRLMTAIEARIRTMNCDFHDHDTYVISEIKGMILLATAGGMFLGGLDKESQARFVAKVNDKLKAWVETACLGADNYVLTLED